MPIINIDLSFPQTYTRLMKRALQLILIAFCMTIITVAVFKYSGAGVAAVTAAFALLGALVADIATQGAILW